MHQHVQSMFKIEKRYLFSANRCTYRLFVIHDRQTIIPFADGPFKACLAPFEARYKSFLASPSVASFLLKPFTAWYTALRASVLTAMMAAAPEKRRTRALVSSWPKSG